MNIFLLLHFAAAVERQQCQFVSVVTMQTTIKIANENNGKCAKWNLQSWGQRGLLPFSLHLLENEDNGTVELKWH